MIAESRRRWRRQVFARRPDRRAVTGSRGKLDPSGLLFRPELRFEGRPEADLQVLLEQPAEEGHPAALHLLPAFSTTRVQDDRPVARLARCFPEDLVAVDGAAQRQQAA